MSWDGDDAADDDFDEEWEDDDDFPVVSCPYCGAEMLEDAPQCPTCGRYISAEDRPPANRLGWMATGIAILLIIAMVLAALR